MAVSEESLARVRPLLVGKQNPITGEWGLRCPIPGHDDNKRSASLNTESGLWYCFACETGGHIDMIPSTYVGNGSKPKEGLTESQEPKKEPLTSRQVALWHSNLLKSKEHRRWLRRRRGLTTETIKHFEIGYHLGLDCYTIPVYDEDGNLLNVRRYWTDPGPDEPKINGLLGRGAPVLYPAEQLEQEDPIIICEGEWDAMLTIQNGFNAITRTGAADVWRSEWTRVFAGRTVYLCHDMDAKGQRANAKLLQELTGVAASVAVIELPYEYDEKHGKDLTDYWLDGNTPDDFRTLLGLASGETLLDPEAHSVSVLDSISGDLVNKPLKIRSNVTGRSTETFLVPRDMTVNCTLDYGDLCDGCPMQLAGGRKTIGLDARQIDVLEFIHSTKEQINKRMFRMAGAPSDCPKVKVQTDRAYTVERLFIREPIDDTSGHVFDERESKHFIGSARRTYVVGKHDTQPNSMVEIVGRIQAHPRSQTNEFVAYEIKETETRIDRFDLTEEMIEGMLKYQARPGKVMHKLGRIALYLGDHVTNIYGRTAMHALMDVTFHSLLAFEFKGKLERKGWLDTLIVGETRTGKSEAAQRLIEFYQMGQMISCESASLAGILGGLQQMGGGKEWEITWGVIPYNDRRLVVLDEVSGLTTDQIGDLSSLRSSGVAQISKIRREEALARVRLLWLGNPRTNHNFVYGTHMVQDLVGKPEDIARFDLAMSVHRGEPGTEDANNPDYKRCAPVYDRESAQNVLLWAWSRKPNQVIWSPGAEDQAFHHARYIGENYIEDPPLLQEANARLKIARVAVAMAARTFSTDETFENVVVRKDHVDAAMRFVDKLYQNPLFGYGEESKRVLEQRRNTFIHYDEAKSYIAGMPGLADYLRSVRGSFRTIDLRDTMGMVEHSEAIKVVNNLWKFGVTDRQGLDFYPRKALGDILREIT